MSPHRRALLLLALCGLLWRVAITVGELPGGWAILGGAMVVGAVTARAVLSRATSRRVQVELAA